MNDHSKDHDGLTARLLSRKDQLSRPEKEQILEGVLSKLSAREQASKASAKRRWVVISSLAGLAGALALAALVLSPTNGDSPEFGARGAGGKEPVLRLSCSNGGKVRTCARGQKLLFEAFNYQPRRHFAAFARRDDGTVIWYFPDEVTGTTLELAADGPGGFLHKGIAIGAEHDSGRYTVYGVFFDQPRTRAEIKTVMENKVDRGFVVVEQELTIP